MDVQINPAFTDKQLVLRGDTVTLVLTPPIGGDYWLLRVPLTDSQAIIAFPKFFTIGIGFQVEADWNTNLPYTCSAKQIFDHIEHNRGDATISEEACIEAIEAIQAVIAQTKN